MIALSKIFQNDAQCDATDRSRRVKTNLLKLPYTSSKHIKRALHIIMTILFYLELEFRN